MRFSFSQDPVEKKELPQDSIQTHLAEREKDILRAIVHSYIMHAEPVGSKNLVQNFGFGVSSATVRNIMSSLESKGYIAQLHCSSGRVPTDKGYHYYINHLMQLRRLTQDEERRIEREFFHKKQEIDFVMRQTTKALCALTECTGLISMPLLQKDAVKDVKVYRIDEFRAIVLAIFDNGVVNQRVVTLAEFFSDHELQVLQLCLKTFLKDEDESAIQGLLLSQEGVVAPRKVFDLLKRIAQLDIFRLKAKEIIWEGHGHLARHPEFKDFEKLSHFLKMLDDQTELSQILEKSMQTASGQSQAQVFIGQDAGWDECSLVTANYRIGDTASGSLGVIGPKRMRYSKVISAVESIANTLSNYLTKFTPKK